MAVTPVTTSSLDLLKPGIAAYSGASLAEMFEFAKPPCQSNWITLDTANDASDTVLSAPGAGKALYVYAAQAVAAAVTEIAHVLLISETGLTTPIGWVGVGVDAQPNTEHFALIRHQCAANAAVLVTNQSGGTAALACRIRFLFAVVAS